MRADIRSRSVTWPLGSLLRFIQQRNANMVRYNDRNYVFGIILILA
jgi:hypothetical protein